MKCSLDSFKSFKERLRLEKLRRKSTYIRMKLRLRRLETLRLSFRKVIGSVKKLGRREMTY